MQCVGTPLLPPGQPNKLPLLTASPLLQKPKWGWVSTQPGASMEIVVNTKLVRSAPRCPLYWQSTPVLASLMHLHCKHT